MDVVRVVGVGEEVGSVVVVVVVGVVGEAVYGNH